MLDVRSIFDSYGVVYSDRGRNVKRGNVVMRCPLCIDDPGQHLGVNLETGTWGCWRNNQHRGSFRQLLRLVGLDKSTIDLVVGAKKTTPVSELRKRFNRINDPVEDANAPVFWPKNFDVISTDDPCCSQHVKHLIGRGYKKREIDDLCSQNDLRYAMSGPFSFRVIFPLKIKSEMRGWTGRDITGRSDMRYRTESNDWGRDVLYLPSTKCDILFMQEGPFDALKVNWVARKHGLRIRSGAFTGTAVVEAQIDLLARTIASLDRPVKLWLGQDRGATANSLRLARQLKTLQPHIIRVPEGFKDVDEMDEQSVLKLLQQMLKFAA